GDYMTKWVGRLLSGALEVFQRDTASRIVYSYQSAPGSRTWSDWAVIPNPSGDTIVGTPAVGVNNDGRLFLFARGNSGKILLRTQVSRVDPTQWNAWSNFLNPAGVSMSGTPALGITDDGRLYLFVRGSDNKVYLQYQTTPGGSWLYNGYTGFGNPSGVTM